MNKKRLFSLLCIILIIIITNTYSFAWDNKVTHKDLSHFAANDSVITSSLNNIGIINGLNENFSLNGQNQTALLWIEDGAYSEDVPITRSKNHFHDPTKQPWSEAGLTDLFNGESSAMWAQDSANQEITTGVDWTWDAIRTYYYDALTATNDADRQAYFAQTFEGLGHQMHLIQDTSQPDHVRNAAHPLDGSGVIGVVTKLPALFPIS